MAANKTGGTTASAKKKTSSGRPPAKKTLASAGKKNRNRKLWGFVFLIFTLLSCLSLITADGFFIRWYTALTAGFFGHGYYLLPFGFLGAAILLLFKKKPRISGRAFCLLAIPVFYGAFAHLYSDAESYTVSFESIAALFSGGRAFTSGGLISGTLAIFLRAAFSRIGAVIFLLLATAVCLIFGFGIRVKNAGKKAQELVGGVRQRMHVDMSDAEADALRKEEQAAKETLYDSIHIPLEGDRPSSGRQRITLRPSAVRAPADVLAETFREKTPQPTPPGQVTMEDAAFETALKRQLEEERRELESASAGAAASVSPGIPDIKLPSRPSSSAPSAEPSAAESAARSAPSSAAEKAAEKEEKAAEPPIPELSELPEGHAPTYYYPPLSLLNPPFESSSSASDELKINSANLLDTLKSFNIDANIINIVRGPSVTRYDLQLHRGTKFSKLTSLSDDIALSLGASSVRIAPIPDKVAVGIEVPNQTVDTVCIREVLDSSAFKNAKSRVSFAVGKDISGSCVVGDIAKMPHMLIAGTTGSGKSVCINSLLISLLYKSSPEEVRFIMVDPKMVELGGYNGIPHLLIPVVTDPKRAAGALNWAVGEMMRRYKLFSEHNVKDLSAYNAIMRGTENGVTLPQVVTVVDELADLMLVAAKEVEEAIIRIAQMGRAAGIHLVIATQRPSTDVITGVMKANIPSRIAFAVASQIESRIILDTSGAEKLIGRGDMLYAPLGVPKPIRVQGCLITSAEVEAVVDYIKNTGVPDYSEEVLEHIEKQAASDKSGGGEKSEEADQVDELLPEAIRVVVESGQASVSLLQRRLKLGYSRAARLIDQMEERGIVGPFEGSKPRQLLITREEWQEMSLRQTE